ncbi:hypothetical protein ACFPRL_08885 [Pseudoclavibacter helvolus]
MHPPTTAGRAVPAEVACEPTIPAGTPVGSPPLRGTRRIPSTVASTTSGAAAPGSWTRSVLLGTSRVWPSTSSVLAWVSKTTGCSPTAVNS